MKRFKILRKKLRALPATQKFIIRILYPIVLFVIFYLIYLVTPIQNLQAVQLFFILVWALLEYLLFFKRDKED